jgi:serine protease
MYRLIRFYLMFLIFLFINFTILSSEEINCKILQPNEKLGRKLKVLSNTILIRIKKEYAYSSDIKKSLKMVNKDIIIDDPFLKPTESMTFDKKMRDELLMNSNLKVNKIIEAEEPLLRTYLVKYPGNEAPEIFCKRLIKENPMIEIAEPKYLPEIQQYYPNDPLLFSQAMLFTIQAPEAWGIETGDSNVVIGISDVGVDQSHEDLINSLAPNYADPVNGIDDDGNGFTDDYDGYDMALENETPNDTYHYDDHGTNVAGIADATPDNSKGMAGVGGKCRFFPIKISKNSELEFSYESIKYAAIRGIKVLNCSWGTEKRYSAIDQSIIDFAVAYDVAIVASGGNSPGSLEDNYPAAYDKVLAVGEVTQSDIFLGCNIGDYLDVLAPGGGNFHTDHGNNYSNSGSGSSYASPVVAGVVALIRSKYPELNALQSLELARQSTDDITDNQNNYLLKDILPGRINAYKAVTTDPFSIPSIRPRNVITKSNDSIVAERFALGDTVIMSIDAYNFLGAADSLKLILSAVWDDDSSIKVIDSLVNINHVDADSELLIEYFSFLIEKENRDKMFFRCDIYGKNDYHDFFLIEYIPSLIVTTFSNNSVSFSVSDRGTIGFGGHDNSSQGVGFVYKDKGNQIWKSCFIASEFEGRLVHSLNWNTDNENDFEAVKKFVPPDRNIGIFRDPYHGATDEIGIEVRQEFILPQGDYTIAKVNIEVKNVSDNDIYDFTSGYYFDWDIFDSDSNIVKILPDAIPSDLAGFPVAVEMMEYAGGNFPVFGCAAVSYEPSAEVQMAGLYRDIEGEALTIMNSGTDIQDVGIFDASIFAGMKFLGKFAKGETKKYSICFGGADNEDDFKIKMKRALDSNYTPVKNVKTKNLELSIFPQPSDGELNCLLNAPMKSLFKIELYDIFGRRVFETKENTDNSGQLLLRMNLKNIETGNYYLLFKNNNFYRSEKVIIIK